VKLLIEGKVKRKDFLKEWRQKSAQELADEVRREEEALMKVRFRSAVNQVQNTSESRFARRRIARLRTVLNEISSR
jgi:ribosomal protein L29